MWINPNSDKGWTDNEEATFAAQYPPLSETALASLAKATAEAVRKRAIRRTETAQGDDLFSPASKDFATTPASA
jgi:hypothetical protein